MAAKQLLDDSSEGWKIGQSSTSLIGFYGATPVVRQTTGAAFVVTTTTTSTTTLLEADMSELGTLVNNIRTALIALGLAVTS